MNTQINNNLLRREIKMSDKTILEFAMGNPNNLNETQLWDFIDNQDFLVIKNIFVVDNGIKIVLSFAAENNKVLSFSNAYKTYNKELIKKSEILIAPTNETINEFSMGNKEKLNEKQISNFIENQDVITINDFILSNQGVKLIVEFDCTQSDTIAFINAFKIYSQNVEEIFEEAIDETQTLEEILNTTIKKETNNTNNKVKNSFFYKISNYFRNFISS
jgi:hypothetical protein